MLKDTAPPQAGVRTSTLISPAGPRSQSAKSIFRECPPVRLQSLDFYIHLGIFEAEAEQYNPDSNKSSLGKMAARKGGIKVHQCWPRRAIGQGAII